MKTLYSIFTTALISSLNAWAQPKIALNLKYNSEDKSYAIYAKANFSQKNFLWGPSQITLVVPKEAPNEKIRIKNLGAGTWEDNSTIFSPKVQPNFDFHGLVSAGSKTDLIANTEVIICYFSLPENILSDKVRIFDNLKDPKSYEEGMQGGDFQNTIIDESGKELYFIENKVIKAEEKDTNTSPIEVNPIKVSVYPNITKEKFKIIIENVEDKENVELILSTESGRVILQDNAIKSKVTDRTYTIPSYIISQPLVARIKINDQAFGVRLILERE